MTRPGRKARRNPHSRIVEISANSARGGYIYDVYLFFCAAAQNIKRQCRAAANKTGAARARRCRPFPDDHFYRDSDSRTDDLYLDKNPIILYNGRVARADASGINATITARCED